MYDGPLHAKWRYSVRVDQHDLSGHLPWGNAGSRWPESGGVEKLSPFIEGQAGSLRKVCWRVWPRALPARLGERDRSISFRVFGKGVTLPVERA